MTPLDRRELLAYSAAFGASFLAAQGLYADDKDSGGRSKPEAAETAAAKRRPMKKSINLWAFPYPQQMSLKECFALAADAGFDAVEINYALEGDLSPQASAADIEAIGRAASSSGIALSGVCSFLYWPYSLTANDPERRKKGLELAGKMIDAASLLGTENLLVVPGAVYIPWLKEMPPVANADCYERSRAAIEKLLPAAEKHKIYLNLENVFANAFLMSPQEMVEFVDSFKHERVQVHFDTGNIMQYQFPQHWIPVLGRRIKNIHFKEFNQRSGEFNLEAFRPLLDGTTDWPAVMSELDKIDYQGYLTFEYFHPYQHWPESLIYQTSAALDRMLGRAVNKRQA